MGDGLPQIDLEAWHRRCAARGVHFQVGGQFSCDGSRVRCVRLGFAMLDERELARAVGRMVESL